MCALISFDSIASIKAQNYDIIAFDLDGTLAPSKSPLEPDMAAVLSQLLGRWKVAVISGASFAQFQKQFLSHLPCPASALVNLSVLPTNGSDLCQYDDNTGEWQCHQDNPLTVEEKQKINAAFKQVFIETGFTVPEKTFGPIIEDRATQITFSAFGMEAPLDVKNNWDADHAKREKMVAILKPLLPEFSVHIGGATSIDITRAGIDKAYGLKKILTTFAIPAARMLYIGDELFPDGNDAPALTTGATCVAITGPQETKTLLEYLLAQS